MKQIVLSALLLLLAHVAVTQQHPDVSLLLKSGERPGDPFADLPAVAKQYAVLGGRMLNHTQLDSAKYWMWDITLAAWSLESQTNYSYSSNSQILLKLDQNLENQSLETWQFDDNGNILEFIYQVWDGSTWVNSFRFSYLYDDDKLIEFIYQSAAGGSYENALRYLYTYDGNGDLVEEITQNWNAGAWATSSRITYTNNGNHQPVLVLQEQWQNEWINEFRYTYTYGSSNELLIFLFEAWESDWMITEQTTYAYDGQLRLIEEAGQVFEGGILIFETKLIYAYDLQGNQTSIIYQNTESGELADRLREVMAYDDENNQTSYVYQYWDDAWVSNDSAFFYWNPVTSIADASPVSAAITLYPNPVVNTLHWTSINELSINHVSVYTIQGQQLQIAMDLHTDQLNVSTLPPGIYIIELLGDNGTSRMRFSKQ